MVDICWNSTIHQSTLREVLERGVVNGIHHRKQVTGSDFDCRASVFGISHKKTDMHD